MQYNGIYRAEVIENYDPEKFGRLKVRVYSLYKKIEVEGLPWAWPCFPMGGTDQAGSFFIPPIGATVWVAFEEGNPNIPVWLGTYYGKPGGVDVSEVPFVFQGFPIDPASNDEEPLIDEASSWAAQYPNNFGVRTPGGIVIEYDDTPGKRRIHLFHPSGSHMEFRENGDLVIHVKGNFHLVVDGNTEELCKSNRHEVIQKNKAVEILMNHTQTISGTEARQVSGTASEIFLSTLSTQAAGKSETITGNSSSISTGVVEIKGSQVKIN